MSTLHVIRLRGPWEYTVLARFDTTEGANLPPPGRVTMPATWDQSLGADFRGRVAYRRRFGKPTNLSPAERVWLVCEGATARATLEINGQSLGEITDSNSPAEFDITTRLAARNEIVAVVESAHEVGGLTGEVRLEMRERTAAY